jgi:general secretion pathway protein A
MEDEEEISYILLTNPSFPTANQLLRAIMQEYQVPQTHRSYLELLNIFKNFLYDQTINHGKSLVLIIDEAQTLKPQLLEMIRQLMNYESNDQKFLQVVLFAQEEFRARLQHARYRNLVNRTAMASTLGQLSLSESEAMLRHRWVVAGGTNFPFTSEAIERIYTFSHGVPRTQVILSDNALLAAFITGLNEIDGDLIDQVVHERGLPDVAPDKLVSTPKVKKYTRGKVVSARRSA